MENISFFNKSDSSDDNNSLLREFPYWQPTLAVTLLLNTTILSGISLVLYLPLLIELVKIMKKGQFKALNFIHVSLLVALVLNNISRICLFSLSLPSAFRSCVCSGPVSAIVLADITFFLVYCPLAFASLSVLQFLTVIRKKKLVNLKVACGIVSLCIAVSFLCIITTVRELYLAGWRPFCTSSCPDSGTETSLAVRDNVILSLSLVILVPSLGVVIVMSTWSCVVFKKYYTGGDDQLNRKMLSLPFIMPIVIIVSDACESLLARLVASLLSMLSLGDLFPYWITFANSILLIFSHSFIGLVYPSVLLYTHTPLRQAVKSILCRFKRPNHVAPATSS